MRLGSSYEIYFFEWYRQLKLLFPFISAQLIDNFSFITLRLRLKNDREISPIMTRIIGGDSYGRKIAALPMV